MKKVLVYGVSGGFGGIESVVHSVISGADKDQVSFDILTFYDSIEFQDEYLEMGVNIFKVTSRRENYFKNKKEMQEFFKNHGKDYDVIWCNLAELINVDVLKLAKKYGVRKRIIHSHSMGSTRNSLLTKLHYIHKRKIGALATDFWACSGLAGKWFYDNEILESEQFKIIKNAIEVNKYAFDTNVREAVREELDLGDSFVLGHVGRFSVGEKNTLFVLDIFHKFLQISPDAKLLMVGEGPDKDLLVERVNELQIQNSVIFTGFRSDINRVMCAMDAFLLPSKMEGFGIVLIEAQACGLPCFTSDLVVPKEVAVTELLHFVGLEQTPEKWAEFIYKNSDVTRESRTKVLFDAGYDIETESKRVQNLLVI